VAIAVKAGIYYFVRTIDLHLLTGSFQITGAILICLQLVLLVFWSLPRTEQTRASIAESVLSLLEAIAIVALSYTQHRRSIRPSILLSGFLILTILFDIASARTYWLRPQLQSIAVVSTLSTITRTIMVVLEEIPKRQFLVEGSKDISLEFTTGVVSRTLFWWLNKLLIRGYRHHITVDDIDSIEEKFGSQKLLQKLERAWVKSARVSLKWKS
jgi:ATP-binding cassette, subfamily C (CFTR/MRP), member 1